jgi:RNA polymerase sigma factor (sigma-70 family)
VNKNNIFKEYGDFILKYLLTLTNDFHAAEELTQETFYQAIKSIHNFDRNGNAKFSTWLCSIAKNVWLQEVNRENKKQQLVESLGNECARNYDVEDAFIQSEEKLNFFKKARELDDVKREVVYLRLLGDLSFREIGIIAGKTENWARVTFYRAKQELRKGE